MKLKLKGIEVMAEPLEKDGSTYYEGCKPCAINESTEHCHFDKKGALSSCYSTLKDKVIVVKNEKDKEELNDIIRNARGYAIFTVY